MAIRVLLADDHRVLRQGLRALIEKQPDVQVVGEATHGKDAVRLAEKLRPDVVVMDVSMPQLNGIEATRLIRAKQPEVRVLALSMHPHRRMVTDMLRAGASGYLLKDCEIEELAGAIRAVVEGKVYLSPDVSAPVVEALIQQEGGDAGALAPLTPKEREVLQLLAEGHAVKAIAHMLGIAERTAHTHRVNIMQKLDLSSTAELTKFAIREGLTSVDV